MTLIEIIVVLAIIAGVLGMGVYAFGTLDQTDLREETMRLAAAIKYTHSQAAMNNTRYRMVFDLQSGEYYTEVTDTPVMVEGAETAMSAEEEGLLPEEARELERRHRAENDYFDDDQSDPFNLNRRVTFQRVESAVIEPRKLPKSVRFSKVMTTHQKVPFREGKATISFFPDGSMERAMVTLATGPDDRANYYTLVTEALTGRVKIYSEDQEIPDDFGREQRDD
jgi:hypothetical protein